MNQISFMSKKPEDNLALIYLEVEKSRIKREKSRIVLNKSLFLYFAFLIVGVIGFAFDYLDSLLLNTLIIMGIFVLIVGTVPYIIVTIKEEKKIDEMIERLKGQ